MLVICKRQSHFIGSHASISDGYELYKSLVPTAQHSQKKYSIKHIERNNLSLCTHIKRLFRKTICLSKSKEMLEACLKIYFWSQERKSLSLVNE